MPKCCSSRAGCSCVVTAGPGVTVDGTGSTAAPYVVSTDAGTPTPVQGQDTATVHTSVGGAGTEAAPYVVSADVILDPDPPGGGDNLLQEGPDGLFMECEQVRGCLTAGPGITYDEATGEIAADGAAGAPTALEAGDTATVDTTVSGTGTTADPYIVSADVILDPAPPGGGDQLLQSGPDGLSLECADIRGCFSAGDGAGYDPSTGVITARPSTDAGNTVAYGTDGGLLVPLPPSVALLTGCGITGDGSEASPLTVATGVWPYDCPVDDIGGVVACDSAGVLRSEPRGFVAAYSYTETRDYPNLTVPSGFDQPGDTFTTTVTNPGCRPALVWMEREVDVDFDLPPGAGAAYGHGGDEMIFHRNTGSSVEQDFHVQTTKAFGLADTLQVGETRDLPFAVTLGRGVGGATYNRIQIFIRVLLIGV
ncbi:hypothetical protein [Streptomyces sp. SID11385]|uniref:hypothetical protein n=1 Tax=Streptomyces sp. SID11385 TaxID=2706031 RepID=UPI0013C8348E|nr:hypothetical protein [Streptomyces sp. SID11385]NEA39274.1 hypothetical protein [Streptomyces sp. SID11385]